MCKKKIYLLLSESLSTSVDAWKLNTESTIVPIVSKELRKLHTLLNEFR